jgi:hypothetical protein
MQDPRICCARLAALALTSLMGISSAAPAESTRRTWTTTESDNEAPAGEASDDVAGEHGDEWPAEPESRSRVHEGFYFQLAGGLGYFSASSGGLFDQNISGLTIPTQMLVGGSIIPGLSIGGGAFVDIAPSPGLSVNGNSLPVDITQLLIGLGGFVDYYLNPQGGFHLQGFAGWGGIETITSGSIGGSDPTGFVSFLGAGYDWRVGEAASVGLLSRVILAPLDLGGVSFFTVSPGLLLTFTYN